MVEVMSEREVLQEAIEILLEHLSPAKVARLLAAWQIGSGDYLTIRQQLFATETVNTIFGKVQTYQQGEN